MTTQFPMDFMVIDDRTVAAIDLETQLEDMGHRVVAVASHIKRAFERLETSAGEIDGVFLNPSLAGCSARPVAEKLFRLGLPYVLLTEMTPAELRRLGMRGPSLPFPAQPAALASALRQITAKVPPRFVSSTGGVTSAAFV